MQKKHKNQKIPFLQRLAMAGARLVCVPLLLVYRMKRVTPDGQPYKGKIRGGAILAANHTTFEDPFLVGVAVWYRRMFFLAAEIVMQGKLRTWLLKGVGAIKIDRHSADIEAIRRSVEEGLTRNEEAREVLWMLPESPAREAMAEMTYRLDEMLQECCVD